MSEEMPFVQTVNGPIATSHLGVVLPHEHIQIDLVREWRGNGSLNNLDLAASELTHARTKGCGTVVDCTTAQIGRDPVALRRASELSGLHVVMGAGHYREPYIDRGEVNRRSADWLAKTIVAEFRDGVDGTEIRPGIIGEVGCEGENPTGVEERTLRAAAIASLETGAAITTHAARHAVGIEQLRLFTQEGVSPSRVIIGHCSTVHDVGYHRELAEVGCFVQFDTIRGLSEFDDNNVADYILKLVSDGYRDQVLVSHDVCLRSHLKAYGGHGYDRLFTHFLPKLRERGLSSADIRALTVDNPARALAIQ